MFEIGLQKKLHAPGGEMLLNVNLTITKGSFTSLFGKSGAGKTTLLKMLAGLIKPEGGYIKVENKIWFDHAKRINITPQKRDVGLVFQDYALFPNMTVQQNLEFVSPGKNKERIKELLNITGLEGLSSKYPSSLSGGQQQRVALARALVREPQLLLLDEPLSALDPEMRLKLQDEIARIHRHYKLTTILISHDPAEIYRLSDKVVEIEQGKIIRQGKPSDVFNQPELSGKIQLTGEVLDISQQDVVYVAKIVSGNQLLKVVITRDQAVEIKPGDRVLVSSKAFNPVLIKIK